MTKLAEQIQRTIRERQLLERARHVVVAVSGGVDSMVLLHVLHELSKDSRWRITVAHFNHCLRGRSSDADERLVRRTAAALHLPIVIKRADVRILARNQKVSLEMAARTARHAFLAATARRARSRHVFLAHHGDDQVELFFLRILRGSGGEGLAGMKWLSPSPADPTIRLVRPLLDIPKSVLSNYAATEALAFREDATNTALDLQRNRIRNELLPLLKAKYQPALTNTVSRLMDIAGAEADFVAAAARHWLSRSGPGRGRKARTSSISSYSTSPHNPRLPFAALHAAVQRRCIELQLIELGVIPVYQLIERLRTDPRPVTLANDLLKPGRPSRGRMPTQPQVCVNQSEGRVALSQSMPTMGFKSQSLQLSLGSKPSNATFDGVTFSWRTNPRRPGPVVLAKDRRQLELFDAAAVGSQIILRHWQPGDRFQPIGMKTPTKLQDLFVNQKVPRSRRHQAIVATTANGEVFWVEGMRISERFKLTRSTNRRLQWRWRRP